MVIDMDESLIAIALAALLMLAIGVLVYLTTPPITNRNKSARARVLNRLERIARRNPRERHK